jgi:cytidine deaminase
MNTSAIKRLIDAAKEARQNSHASYSNFTVGAALTTIDGKIFTGANVESSSYGLTICAERVALVKALSEGKDQFKAIAVVGPYDDFCPPCGACRQLLFDYAPEIEIILTDGKQLKQVPLKDLFPFAFEKNRLKKK